MTVKSNEPVELVNGAKEATRKDKQESDFERQTIDGLKACGKWLEDNAGKLASVFAEGCQDWSVEFHFETYTDLPGVPGISISVNKLDRGVIDAYLR